MAAQGRNAQRQDRPPGVRADPGSVDQDHKGTLSKMAREKCREETLALLRADAWSAVDARRPGNLGPVASRGPGPGPSRGRRGAPGHPGVARTPAHADL